VTASAEKDTPSGDAWGRTSIRFVTSATERRERLKAVYEEARVCVRCPLHLTRTQVVFGAGNATAALMFVGEAPGANEDKQGLPFVGQAGKLLGKLLEEIGLAREDVFVCNVIKCRPPNNRDPHPSEIESCQGYLRSQVALIEPTMICTLGNFATKLLRADSTGISKLHGQEEVRSVGARAVRLYPLYHPAAALYTPATLDALRADFRRIPELLALGAPEQPKSADEGSPGDDVSELEATGAEGEVVPERESAPGAAHRPGPDPARTPDQLGLF